MWTSISAGWLRHSWRSHRWFTTGLRPVAGTGHPVRPGIGLDTRPRLGIGPGILLRPDTGIRLRLHVLGIGIVTAPAGKTV